MEPTSFDFAAALPVAVAAVRSRSYLDYDAQQHTAEDVMDYLTGLRSYLDEMVAPSSTKDTADSFLWLLDLCILEHFNMLDGLTVMASGDDRSGFLWRTAEDSSARSLYFASLLSSANQFLVAARTLMANGYGEQARVLERSYFERITTMLLLVIDREFAQLLGQRHDDGKEAMKHWNKFLSMSKMQERLRRHQSERHDRGIAVPHLTPVTRPSDDRLYGYLSNYSHGGIDLLLMDRFADRAGGKTTFHISNHPLPSEQTSHLVQNLITFSWSSIRMIDLNLRLHHESHDWRDHHPQGSSFMNFKTDVGDEIYGRAL